MLCDTALPKALTRSAPVAAKLTEPPKPTSDTAPLASSAKLGVPVSPCVTNSASAPFSSAKLALEVSPIWPFTLLAPISSFAASTCVAVVVNTVSAAASAPANAPL